MAVDTCDPSIQEAEEGGSQVQIQQGSTARHGSKPNPINNTTKEISFISLNLKTVSALMYAERISTRGFGSLTRNLAHFS